MAETAQAKRIKIMAIFVILLLLVFVLKSNKGRSSGGGMMDKIIGANLDQKYSDFKSATVQRNAVICVQ